MTDVSGGLHFRTEENVTFGGGSDGVQVQGEGHMSIEVDFSPTELVLLQLAMGAREHLEGDDYHVKSEVSPEILAEFEKGAKENGSWKATPANAKGLLLLAEEFGLDPLKEECQAVLGTS
jgi:hypothetical protein